MEQARKKEKKIIKSGFSPLGKQMYKDTETGRRFIPESDKSERGHPASVREQALNLYMEGVGLRSIGRFLGCSHASVIRWVREASKKLESLSSTLIEQSKVGTVELDEMWHFHKKKREKNGSGSHCPEKQCK